MRKTFSYRWSCVTTMVVMLSAAALAQTRPQTVPATRPPTPPSTSPAEKPNLEYVLMKTTMGDIVLELNREKAPITVDNFMSYVDKHFYDGTLFHRIVKKGPGSMIDVIQGGGFTANLIQKPTDPPIKNEWQNGLKNDRGTISMARMPAPDSATSQFFINVTDDSLLDQPNGGAAYAVFGKVVAGMSVVEAIHNVPTTAKTPAGSGRPLQGLPAENVIMQKVTRITPDEAHALVEAEKKPPATQPKP